MFSQLFYKLQLKAARLIILIVAVVAFLVSCNPGKLVYDKPYFDFDSLVEIQTKWIGAQHDSIKKIATVNGHTDVSAFTADTTDMKRELEVFKQLDVINKPLFKNAYALSIATKDPKSNLLVKNYSIKKTHQGESVVPYVRIYYLNEFWHIKKIEASYKENNLLYSTHRYLVMEFDQVGNKLKLNKYLIKGFEKMILNDSVKFSIEAIVY
ncbi:MAG: hypothetical protein ACKO96_06740 [Flammeovirgaceae bacterium]